MANKVLLPSTVHMRRFDPEHATLRMYTMREQLSLFGPPELLIEWGRLEWKRMHFRTEQFVTLEQLVRRKAALFARRRRHGYAVLSAARSLS